MQEVPQDRRTQKRLATRQKISDAATCLFMEHGFDHVTVDQIAAAAEVSRMTVFNHFSRKEDMIFDLDDVGRQDILDALEHRPAGVPPVEALRLFAHRAVAEGRPYMRFSEGDTDRFAETVQGSPVLLARARAIRDEIGDLLADSMARSVGRSQPDADASLAAALIVATWQVAFLEARRTFNKGHGAKRANKTFLAIVDRGSAGVSAALAGTRYA